MIFFTRRRDDLVPAVGDTGLPRGLCPRHGGRVQQHIRHIHRYERRRPVLHAGQQPQPTSVLKGLSCEMDLAFDDAYGKFKPK